MTGFEDSKEESGANRQSGLETPSSQDSEKDGHLTSSANHQSNGPVVEKVAGPGPPPDGGTKAWLQVVGGFLLVLNTWYILFLFLCLFLSLMLYC